MRVLGIETSCDETGIAVFDSDEGLIADAIYSQAEMHARFGGVVPELASRDHIRKTLPLIREVLSLGNLETGDLDAVAYTSGPGLVGALMVGATIGRSFAWARGLPSIGVHHMEGHLLAPLLSESKPSLPFVALLVSGGHTQLVRVDAIGRYTLMGESLDDAAGEAFDKTAKLLGLGYPGGPALAALAESGRPGRFTFPKPMTRQPGLNFSFSGLKTAAMTTIRNIDNLSESDRADIANAFEEAVVETLTIKCVRALEQAALSDLVIAGGVAANQRLRERLGQSVKHVFYAPASLCTDNGAMIAFAGHERLRAGFSEPLVIRTHPRWSMEELPEVTVPDNQQGF